MKPIKNTHNIKQTSMGLQLTACPLFPPIHTQTTTEGRLFAPSVLLRKTSSNSYCSH